VIIELITLIAIVMVPALIVYGYSRIGVLGELSTRFPIEESKKKLKWIPFVVEQYGKENNVFVSNAKVGISEQRLFIRYIFPFSLIIRGYDVPINQIVYIGLKRRYGILFRIIKIEGIDTGCLMLPELFLDSDHKRFFDNQMSNTDTGAADKAENLGG
jgi:hypothetical protein